jgi:hypothetical protein
MFDVELCAFHVGRIFFSVRLSYELVELFRTLVDGSPEKGGELGGKQTNTRERGEEKGK